MKVSTSFLACKDIYDAILRLDATDADYIHVDFIDGKFVVGRKIPYRKLKKISTITSKRIDVHLMTDKLDKYIPKFSMLNCEYITFHIEATKDIERYIRMIHSYGIKCGIAVNPNTDIELLEPYIDLIDLVLVMGVNPGYGGQEFKNEVLFKLQELRRKIDTNKLDLLISVDGGINSETINKVKDYADMVVGGSFVTKENNYQEQINLLRK